MVEGWNVALPPSSWASSVHPAPHLVRSRMYE
eukprot:CAMPEP_0174332740 /NCGR_PEP_ID=MMETSP0810-20121108/18546_1 /TAXON_ID=73025 ORGANISM="Eutreptiella gymnastica-like, Strain CCMP1594" /NCGR_SAMPLE_ID=MMETSP0810 /ASSEMBLY_ACC=CAM_ASM_000659 /LENGTH=31 /DNA_ID= /DNA_START= /DNA_END= /DNA_ORIENTATION=